jgi:hypothetical protein
MSFILKNTSGLVNTRLTDTGRLKLSQGNFNISYFQIGDSEVSYNTLPLSYNQGKTNILDAAFNAQNSSGAPETNKQNVKYPYYTTGSDGNTYGIPFMDSSVTPIFNRAAMRGFFNGNLTATTINWSAMTDNKHVINSNFVISMSGLTGGTVITLISSECNSEIVRMPSIGDIITIFYDGNGNSNCFCGGEILPTPTPTPTMTPTPSQDACRLPLPTPTPSSSCCITPTPPYVTPTPIECEMSMSSCYSMLTYKIVDVCLNVITLDRPTPDFSYLFGLCLYSRVIIYPPNMQSLYDSYTPLNHWSQNVIDFESICSTDEFDVKVWNMNIPWSENPAGLISSQSLDYSYFGSSTYLGTKEYLGYMSDSGQTDTSLVYYNNSLGQEIDVAPKDQKAISIIHYTNQTIEFFYGEKFAFEPYDSSNPQDTTGEARNFRFHIPWLMWHKSTECCLGQTFYVDPPGFDKQKLFQVQYTTSSINPDTNNPGMKMRYYNLWDTNANILTGIPNRIGKVYPDQKIIVIDDEEIIAAMSYKSNRNWTLPAPQISLLTPNTCGTQDNSNTGLLTNTNEYLYVTYRLDNTSAFTESLHCNYYSKIQGPDLNCGHTSSQNVAIRFGTEFPCLNQINGAVLNNGFFADTFQIICQKVIGDVRPNSADWVVIDITNQLSASTINNYITQDGLTEFTFVITQDMYNSGTTYNLNNYESIKPVSIGQTGTTLNFGDEYYFYGSIETDIEATIYEMKCKVNLGQADFQSTSNPTWSNGSSSYITEIGLYDSDKNLMIISKLQSPVLRQGIQQFLVKFDF